MPKHFEKCCKYEAIVKISFLILFFLFLGLYYKTFYCSNCCFIVISQIAWHGQSLLHQSSVCSLGCRLPEWNLLWYSTLMVGSQPCHIYIRLQHNVKIFFCSKFTDFPNKLEFFFSGKRFQPCLLFVGKARSLPQNGPMAFV